MIENTANTSGNAAASTDIDELSNLMASDSTSVTPNSTAHEHPRFSQYKNSARAADAQAKRRSDYLERQKNARFNYANHARKLALNEFDEEDDVMDEGSNEAMEHVEGASIQNEKLESSSRVRKRNRYAGELMTSEWLIDIPEELSSDWIFLPCPAGKRCMVVASSGVTNLYAKNGFLMKQCVSYLPGGGCSQNRSYTILDCVYNDKLATLYCLDIIAWNGVSVSQNDFECRLFLLNSRIAENLNFQENSGRFAYRIICLPYCRCDVEEIRKMMQRDFEFKVDGVLFYHASVRYRRGQSPLVGWLKPWMLPEILQVDVPNKYLGDKHVEPGSSMKYIEAFNEKHKHKSKIEKKNSAKE